MLTFLANSLYRNKLTNNMENIESHKPLENHEEKYDEIFEEEEITSNYKFAIFKLNLLLKLFMRTTTQIHKIK